jgi:hypothetical protein
MPRKVFTAGEVLAAADVNSFLMDQTIMTFAGTAARGSAIGTATEGMYAHLNDTDTLTYYNGSAWVNRIGASAGILQVVSTTKTDTFTMTSSTYADITGLSATITPSSATSKIYISVSLVTGMNVASTATQFQLLRDSTAIALGDADGSRTRASSGAYAANINETVPVAITVLDSPSTTSAVTYKVQMRSSVNTFRSVINRSDGDVNNAANARYSSTITLMEVAG